MDKYFNINGEGCSIRCKLYSDDRSAPDKLILFGHGFGGHKDNKAAERFARRAMEKNRGVALLAFNWPCHGDDVRKRLRLDDCMLYLDLIVDHVNSHIVPGEFLGYATSFGGFLFMRYILDKGSPFARLALRCPAVDMYDVLTRAIMTDQEWDRIRKGKPALAGFDRKVEIDGEFLDSLKRADLTGQDLMPYADDILILHGTKDEIVPLESVRAFAEANVIEFETVEGADHRFQDKACMDRATARILTFFGLK